MLVNRPRTKILVDGGDPEETRRIKALLGFVDGQTTNPTLIAKNPEIRQRIASGRRLSSQEQNKEYKRIVQTLSPMVGDADVSIEVFADLNTSAEQMLAQGEEMFLWIPNAYIKYPCTHEGLRAAELSVRKKHSSQHDAVFLTGASGRGIRGHERLTRGRLCLTFRW